MENHLLQEIHAERICHRRGTQIEELLYRAANEIERLRKYVFDKDSLFAWQSLKDENERLRAALSLIAAPIRPDGTWNRDRMACYRLAAEALKAAPPDSAPEAPGSRLREWNAEVDAAKTYGGEMPNDPE